MVAEESLRVYEWRAKAADLAARMPRHKLGMVMFGNSFAVPCRLSSGASVALSVVDVPGVGNCLYHAVWQSARLQGLDRPFNFTAFDHVFFCALRSLSV